MTNHRSSPKWNRILWVPVLWLSFGPAAGALFAWLTRLNESAFDILVFVGFLHGLAGCVAHGVLFMLPAFKSAPWQLQVMALWFCTLVSMAAMQFVDAALTGSKPSMDVIAYLSLPVLGVAFLFNRIVCPRASTIVQSGTK